MARRLVTLVCILVLSAHGACALAETTSFQPRMVAAFKNGLGFFVRTGEATLSDGWGVTDFVPQAALGTFWMSTTAPGAYVDQVTAYTDEVDKKVDIETFEDLFRANVGKMVRISRSVEPRIVEGELMYVPASGFSFVQVKTLGGETLTFPGGQIMDVVFPDGAEIQKTRKQTQKHIKFRLENAPAKAPVSMAYLSKGITWMPSYLVNIEDPKKARVTFQAMLVNDVEDLENVDVFFVVGYPNFQFADTMSPIALQQRVTEFVEGIRRGTARVDYLANIATQSAGRYSYGGLAPVDAGYSAAVATPGQAEEDLFLYSKRGVSLKNGQRAAYTIFSEEVGYEHVYEWAVDDTSGIDPVGSYRPAEPDKLKDAVWHSLRVTNTTDYPWTTAPAFAVSEDKPLAQDTMNYTSKGAKTNLKLTVATDVAPDKREDEISREHGVIINSSRFDEVTVEGELQIKNYKTKAIRLLVTKNITGEVLESGEGKVHKLGQGVKAANPQSVIDWDLALPAGETAKLKYKYKVYVRY